MQIPFAACPLCGGQSVLWVRADCRQHAVWHEPLPPELEWMHCPTCGHVHTKCYWSSQGLAEVFSRAHANQVANAASVAKKIQIWKPVVQAALRLRGGYAAHMDQSRTWLDVGCGDGALIMAAKEYGFLVAGLDARAQAVQALTAMNIPAFQLDVMDAFPPQPVQVLSMMNLLEHTPYPHKTLEKARSIMADGGLLIMSMPNRESNEWHLLNREQRNPYWIELEHYHNFSMSTLTTLLKEHAFIIKHMDIPQGRYRAQMEVYAEKNG